MVFHGSDYLGYSGFILRIPSERIFIAILSNDGRRHACNLDYPARKIAALIFDDPFTEWQAIEMSGLVASGLRAGREPSSQVELRRYTDLNLFRRTR
jgi:hypothetical protein